MSIFESSTTFGASRALILGNSPSKLSLPDVQVVLAGQSTDPNKVATSEWGLFNTGAPNYNTYYPDLDVEDVKNVSEADFIYPIYRALSQTIVSKYLPIDFSSGSVLKDSMPLLKGQSLYPNHEQIVGQELGVVLEVAWQEQTTKAGIKIPAGINAKLKFDVKSAPKIARGMLMEPPSVHSTSVTVTYRWEKSHKDLSDSEFFNKVGAFDKNGELVRAIVKEIKLYQELSLVPHGADRFAQKIGADGKIINPAYAESRKQFSAEPITPKTFVYFDYTKLSMEDADSSFASSDSIFNPTIPFNNNSENENENFDFMKREEIIQMLGLSEDATDAQIKQAIQDAKSKADAFEAQDEEEEEDSNSDDASNSGNDDSANSADDAASQILESEREDAVAAYRLAMGNDADPEMVQVIQSSTFKQARVLRKQYEKMAKASYGKGASAEREDSNEDSGDDQEHVALSNEEATRKLLESKHKRKSYLHQHGSQGEDK